MPTPSPDTSRWAASHEHTLADLLLRQSRAHGVIFMDADGCIRGWSEGAAFITGYTAAEVIGQSVAMLFTPEDRERGLDEQELRIAREVGFGEDERWHLRKDGSAVWTTGVSLPVRDAHDALTGFVKIFRDASHLRSRAKYLENVLADCHVQRSQQDFFLGTIAHELRGPLAPLKNALHIVQRLGVESHSLQQPVAVMGRQLGILERLVEDLIDLTRVNAGKLSISYARIMLQQLAAEAKEACDEAAAIKGVSVQLVLPGVPLEVQVDTERMLQVLGNLLNNAIKYTPRGGTIWLSVTADQTHFLVFVKDTGRGIGPELLPKVFDAFTQAGDIGTQRSDGIGLGLAVVKEIITLHRGTVEVRSEGEGKGSEFILRVPLRTPDGPEREPMPRPVEPEYVQRH